MVRILLLLFLLMEEEGKQDQHQQQQQQQQQQREREVEEAGSAAASPSPTKYSPYSTTAAPAAFWRERASTTCRAFATRSAASAICTRSARRALLKGWYFFSLPPSTFTLRPFYYFVLSFFSLFFPFFFLFSKIGRKIPSGKKKERKKAKGGVEGGFFLVSENASQQETKLQIPLAQNKTWCFFFFLVFFGLWIQVREMKRSLGI